MADARIADSRTSMGVLRDSVFDGCGDILDVLLAEMLSFEQPIITKKKFLLMMIVVFFGNLERGDTL